MELINKIDKFNFNQGLSYLEAIDHIDNYLEQFYIVAEENPTLENIRKQYKTIYDYQYDKDYKQLKSNLYDTKTFYYGTTHYKELDEQYRIVHYIIGNYLLSLETLLQENTLN